MKKFKIEVINKKPTTASGILWHEGKLTVGSFKEILDMPLDVWTLQDYKQQWKEGLDRLKTHDSSCFVTFIMMTKFRLPCLRLWKLYKVDTTIFVTYQLISCILLKTIPPGESPCYSKTCYQLIDQRVTNEKGDSITEEGHKIVEWSIAAEDFFASVDSNITRLAL